MTMCEKNGVYAIPDASNDCFHLILYRNDASVVLPSTTYEKQIIDFTDIDMSLLEDIIIQLRSFDLYTDNGFNEDLATTLLMISSHMITESFYRRNPVYSFLLDLEIEKKRQETPIRDNTDLEGLLNHTICVIENMLVLQNEVRSRCSTYCRVDGTHKQKLYEMLNAYGEIPNRDFRGFFWGSRQKEFFTDDCNGLPINVGFFFETLSDYVWFVFMWFLTKDVNFSECHYCGHFFIPATRRKTRYCDRVGMEDGKTCKQIGPLYVKKKLYENEPMFEEYSKAVARYYKRLVRTENRATQRHTDKELDAITYNKWLDKVREAKRQWLDRKLTDEEFAAIIHELD